jgi:hypothetical protein
MNISSTHSDRFSSSDLHVEGPTPARYWGDQWLRVSEKVLKGLNHQLTNRVTSLDAIAAILAPEIAQEENVAGTMQAEVRRLHELLFLYRSLTFDHAATPEAVRLQDVLPVVTAMHEHHVDLRHIQSIVTGDVNTEPVLVRHSALLRCLLVVLESVAGNSHRSGARSAIAVEFGNEGKENFVRMKGPAPKDQLLFSGEGSLLHAVRAALSHARGSIEGRITRSPEKAWIEYELRLPTLSAVRGTAANTE